MRLTLAKTQELKSLSKDFVRIINNYIENDPTQFSTAVEFLKNCLPITNQYGKIGMPEIENELNNIIEKNNHGDNFQLYLNKEHPTEDYNKYLRQVNETFFNQEVRDICKIAFADKPITGLSTNINKNKNEDTYTSIDLQHRFIARRSSKMVTYTFQFFDGTAYSLNSLENQKEMKKVEKLFNEKVQEFQNQNDLPQVNHLKMN